MPLDHQIARRKQGLYAASEYDATLLRVIDKHELRTSDVARLCRVHTLTALGWTLPLWDPRHRNIPDPCFELLLIKLGEDVKKYFSGDGSS